MTPEYKPVGERHRVLNAIERYWGEHPTRELIPLLIALSHEGEEIKFDIADFTDRRLLREINRKL